MATLNKMESYLKTAEEHAALRAMKDRLNKEAYENWDNPAWRHDRALEISDTIYWGFKHESLINQMTTVVNAGEFERVYIEEARGLRAFWMARGGIVEASSMFRERAEIEQDQIGFRVGENTDKLRSNFAETQATLIELGGQRLDAEVNRRVLALYRAATPSSGANSNYSSSTSVGLPALNLAIRQVKDAATAGDLNDNVLIIGRPTMTEQIMDALLGTSGAGSNFLLNSNENFVQNGINALGTYRGATIVEMKNYQDDLGNSFFPGNELYVVTQDAAKFVYFGGQRTKEWEENDNWYWHFLTTQNVGVALPRTNRVFRIVDSDQPA